MPQLESLVGSWVCQLEGSNLSEGQCPSHCDLDLWHVETSWDRLGCPICQRPGCCWEVLEAFIDGNMILYYLYAINSHKPNQKLLPMIMAKRIPESLPNFPCCGGEFYEYQDIQMQNSDNEIRILQLQFQLVATIFPFLKVAINNLDVLFRSKEPTIGAAFMTQTVSLSTEAI